MSGGWKVAIWVAAIAGLGGTLATVLLPRLTEERSIDLKGAVIRQDADTRKELPIADVQVTAIAGLVSGNSRSDSSGLFSLSLTKGIKPGQPLTLKFRHPEYQPLDWDDVAADKLYLARMVPIPLQTRVEPNHPEVIVANVLARYSIKTTTEVNIGSSVKTFQVVNTGNVPCNARPPCSPDGKWKASIGSASVDAGVGNKFRNVRASCIAGPCPFTKIEREDLSSDGRTINVSARNWSDTATFLLEAEVYHPMVGDMVRKSYPVVFGPALNFTLPSSAEGVSIEAEINGAAIIFPLGPNLFLSWAECNERVNNDQTKVYRCELKPGYRFP
jgi:hypothetical protein